MSYSVSREQVQAMAPDASSSKAGAALAVLDKWETLGINQQALWGECKGSGKKPYQAQVELASYSSRCSCPSRKFPCKHVIGLLFLFADQATSFRSESTAPLWVEEWIKGRQERAVKKEAQAEKKAQEIAANPEKQAELLAKREKLRWEKIHNGVQEFQRWLIDQFQHGFANFSSTYIDEWRNMAARMVDAQAPGLSRMLLSALELIQSGNGKQQQAIEQLGLIQILLTAALRQKELSSNMRADVRTALGWPMDKEEILSGLQEHAISIEDQWLVIGQITEQLVDVRLTERRIWFYGKNSKQYALLLDFAFQGKGFESTWCNQHSYQATLRYYPSQAPLRALVVEHEPNFNSQICWPQISLQDSMDHTSTLFAMVPWLARAPIFLSNTKIIPYADKWLLQTGSGVLDLDINDSDAWMLLAFSGGHLLDIFAEWNGNELTPLSAQIATDENEVHSSQEYWLQTQRMVVA